MFKVKIDSNGNEEWNQTFGGSYDDCGYSVQQTTDNGFIITGCTKSYGSGAISLYSLWLIKTNSLGDEEWNRTFIGNGRGDIGYRIYKN